LTCYVISVVVWIIGLSRVDVTIAYPLLSLGYIINAIGAWYFLGEVMSAQRILAITIIIVGVIILTKS
jgi:drug/metabolite transporter (DMT)-like permease